jgi:hypothetical protein
MQASARIRSFIPNIIQIMGGIGTGCPDMPSCLFYNQVVFHLYDAFDAAGNFRGLCGACA